MEPVCRAANCGEPPQRLPEDMEFLGVEFCSVHIAHLLAVAEEAPDGMERYAVLVEARRLVDPPEGPALTLLGGGRAGPAQV